MEDRQQRNDRKAQPVTNSMFDAIAAKFEQQAEKRVEREGFVPDPKLEQLGAQLDVIRENSPAQFNDPGLAQARSQVTLYRRRKAAHEQENSR